jgi:hypothetical protein
MKIERVIAEITNPSIKDVLIKNENILKRLQSGEIGSTEANKELNEISRNISNIKKQMAHEKRLQR